MALSLFASFRAYVLSSLVLTALLISHAVYTKRFFYRSVVHLSYSKFAILAVGNMALVSVLLVWRAIQAIFLGPLRFRERERLHIRARDAIIECCFAISVFRDEFDLRFVAMIMTLLLLKSLHWLANDRIEFVEEQPVTPLPNHIRLISFLFFLLALDTYLVYQCLNITLSLSRRTMFVLFAFEFAVLYIELLAHIFKYIILLIDARYEHRWHARSLYTFYSELLCDMCQLTVYLLFFAYVQVYYSFPFHIIRELYVTFVKFQRRCADFLRYRRVVATMNDIFPDATEEELSNGDRTCIICREEMQHAKKLSCGHMFHIRCLQSWLKRQLSCPTCRAPIDVNPNTTRNNNNNNNQQNENQPNVNQQDRQIPNAANPNANANANPNPNPNNNNARNNADPTARLVEIANQWWNQVVNDAGVRPNNNARPPRPPQPQQPPLRQQPHPMQRLQRLQPQNALAHFQLRQRRQDAWPYQPMHFAVARNAVPGQNAVPPIPPQQPQAIPQQPAPQQMPPSIENNPARPASPPSQNPIPEQTNAPRSNPTTANAPSASADGASASSAVSSSTIPSSAGSSGAGSSGLSRTAVSRQVPTANGAYWLANAPSPSLPLERLFAIQQQIELLRSEVQALVLDATQAQMPVPTPSLTPASVPASAAHLNANRNAPVNGAAASSSESTVGAASSSSAVHESSGEPIEQVNDETEAALADEGEEDNSEAAQLRRRRLNFLERTQRS